MQKTQYHKPVNINNKERTIMSNTDILAKLRENSKRKGGKRFRNREYTIKTDGNMDSRLSPQAITCLEILFASGKKTVSEEELHNILMEAADQFKTKQTPWKVFQYYRKSIIEAGFLTMVKVAKKETTPDKK